MELKIRQVQIVSRLLRKDGLMLQMH